MASGEHAKVIGLATAMAGKVAQLGLQGPVTVRLTTEDGIEVERMLGGSATIYSGRGANLMHWFESAGIRFEWIAPDDDEERKNLGL